MISHTESGSQEKYSRVSVVLLKPFIHDIVHLSLPMVPLVLLRSQPTLSMPPVHQLLTNVTTTNSLFRFPSAPAPFSKASIFSKLPLISFFKSN